MSSYFESGFGDCGNPALEGYLNELPDDERIAFENELKTEDPEAWEEFQEYLKKMNQYRKL